MRRSATYFESALESWATRCCIDLHRISLRTIFRSCPRGNLTKLRAQLVSREGLRVHAKNIGLGKYLMMGRRRRGHGGRERASALADAL